MEKSDHHQNGANQNVDLEKVDEEEYFISTRSANDFNLFFRIINHIIVQLQS